MQEKILKITSPLARKSHVCAICGKQIEKGERYMNTAVLSGGRVVSRKQHADCHTEESFRKGVSVDTRTLLDTFTFEENMQIAFFPLVITELAWLHAFKVLDLAARDKISETRKLSRAVREVRKKYVSDCGKDLDSAHMRHIEESTAQFHGKCATDFTLLYYSANNELKRTSYDLPYLEMRTYAYMSLAMLDALVEHNRKMNRLIASRLGLGSSLVVEKLPGTTLALRECMEAYMSPARYEKISHIQNSISVILNKISQCEFVIH